MENGNIDDNDAESPLASAMTDHRPIEEIRAMVEAD
jgi:hypothetical protein